MKRSRGSLAGSGGQAPQALKVLLAAVCLLLSLPLPASQARDLVVIGEPTLMTALQRVGAAWRVRSGVRVNVFVAPSDLSFAQIDRGARCDVVFALAGPATQDAERRGTIKRAPNVPTFGNRLELVARAGEAAMAGDRAEPASVIAGKRLAIANPDRDLAGAYALAWLGELASRAETDKKLLVAESSAGVVEFLGSGTADLGIVYATDLAAYLGVTALMPLPEQSHPPIRYLAEQASGQESDPSQFFTFLGSDEAKSILQAAGLQVVRE